MAITQNTLIGRSRKKIGGVIMSKWKGLNVIRSKPLQVKNPQAPGQRGQRNKWTIMNLLFRPLLTLLNAGFNSLAINKSAYNVAFSKNAEFIDVTNPDAPVFDTAEFLFSQGNLAAIPEATVNVAGLNEVNVELEGIPEFTPDGRPQIAYVCMLPKEDLDGTRVYFGSTVATGNTISVDLGVAAVGTYSIHAFVSAQAGAQASTSQLVAADQVIS